MPLRACPVCWRVCAILHLWERGGFTFILLMDVWTLLEKWRSYPLDIFGPFANLSICPTLNHTIVMEFWTSLKSNQVTTFLLAAKVSKGDSGPSRQHPPLSTVTMRLTSCETIQYWVHSRSWLKRLNFLSWRLCLPSVVRLSYFCSWEGLPK